MPLPSIPAPVEDFGERPFSFYPPVLNIEHNEWRFGKSTWSELLVVNTKTGQEIWVPRRFIGAVSAVDEPVMIVGLLKELEYKAGSVWPYERRLIEMPRPSQVGPPSPNPQPEPKRSLLAGLSLESGAETRIGRLIAAVLVVGVLLCFVVISVFRASTSGQRVEFQGIVQSDLPFTSEDDYHAIVRALGPPAQDVWRASPGEMQYRKLTYPGRSLIVILMGTEQTNARYIGSVDGNWKPVHSVRLPAGTDSVPVLRGLKPF